MSQMLQQYHWESLGAAGSKIERLAKTKTSIFDTFELLVDAHWMHGARGHEWFQTASPFQTHAAVPGKSRTR